MVVKEEIYTGVDARTARVLLSYRHFGESCVLGILCIDGLSISNAQVYRDW